MLQRIKVEDAVGRILSHDITEIRKGSFKGPTFKKGHKIREADICLLQRLGKRHIYVLTIEDGYLHEDDAATAMAEAFCGPGVGWDEAPREGKIKLKALHDGLLVVDPEKLMAVNLLGSVICATRHTNSTVAEGDVVAATRAIPLVIEKAVIDRAVGIAASGLFQVKVMRKPRAGVVITGNEVFTRLIEDRFEPVLREKIANTGGTCLGAVIVPDEADRIAAEVRRFIDEGADLIFTTGGMSVDPDDVTRHAIREAGAMDCIYGAPMLPGAMFMVAYIGEVPMLGIPACGIYHDATILDVLLPRVLAGERLTRRDLAALGHGGLCLGCRECRFPACPFGKLS